ncbi:sugar transporter ERD6-like 15 [Amaranthus tricolor]|uniref:sugar transporter ERD6-like 15 n=1 Tax=Amaranthus tricolor TaxID=29722 RepID=UPI00258DEE17|nr:sugar transporter ERD6-like 15 [Amaranthus tricolor]
MKPKISLRIEHRCGTDVGSSLKAMALCSIPVISLFNSNFDLGAVVERPCFLSKNFYKSSISARLPWHGVGIVIIYVVTLSIFPGFITEDVHSTLLGDWYPILLFTSFNVFDLVGKSLTSLHLLENENAAIGACFARLLFYPLYWGCLHVQVPHRKGGQKWGDHMIVRNLLTRLRGEDADTTHEVAQVLKSLDLVKHHPKVGILDLLETRYMPSLAVGLMAFQQCGVVIGIGFYTSEIFLAAVKRAGCKSGHFRIKLITSHIDGFGLGSVRWNESKDFIIEDHDMLLEWIPSLVLFGVVWFISSFSSGYGAIPWVIMSEFHPTLFVEGISLSNDLSRVEELFDRILFHGYELSSFFLPQTDIF